MSSKSQEFETRRMKLQVRSAHFHTVFLNNITAPEALVLRFIHGEHALEILESQGPAIQTRQSETGVWLKRAIRPGELLEKLKIKYQPPNVDKVFPGANPVLPFTFEQAGLTGEQEAEVTEEDGWEPMYLQGAPGEPPAKKQGAPGELPAQKQVKTAAEDADDILGEEISEPKSKHKK